MALFGKKRQDISGVESWSMEQVAEYLNNSSKTFGNSEKFEAVRDALNNLREVKQQQVSKESLLTWNAANERLAEACQNYIQSREGAITGQGKDRMNVMRRLNEIQTADKNTINQARDLSVLKAQEGKTWEAVGQIPVATAVIKPDTKVQGANSSARYEVTVNGKKGFFTAQNYAVSSDVQTRSHIENIQDPEVKDLLSRNSEWIAEKMEVARGDGWLSTDTGKVGEMKVEAFKRYVEACARELEDSAERSDRKAGRDMRALAENPRALKECADMLKAEQKRGTALSTGKFEMDGSSISDRNIATSRMAALLGVERIAARSERMVVTKDGRQIEGSFMEFAEGVDLGSIRTKRRFDNAVVELNAGFNRDHSTLEVFDYICAQKDRHATNIFYKLEPAAPDGTRRITGMQGIDNDLSFAATEMRGRENSLDELHLIDADMAERVQNLTRSDLEYAVGDLISAKEMDALENRVNALKAHLGDMVKLRGDEWKLDRYKGREMPKPDAPGLDREEKAYIKGIAGLEEQTYRGGQGSHRAANLRSQLAVNAYEKEIEPAFVMEGMKDLFAEAEGRTPENKNWEAVKREVEAEKTAKQARQKAEAAAQQPQAKEAAAPEVKAEQKAAAPEAKPEQKEAAPKENTARGTWRAPEKMNVDQLAAEQKKERPTLGGSRTSRTFQRTAEKKAAEIKTPEKKAPEKAAAAPGMKR